MNKLQAHVLSLSLPLLVACGQSTGEGDERPLEGGAGTTALAGSGGTSEAGTTALAGSGGTSSAGASALAGSGGMTPNIPTLESAKEDYPSWHRFTEEPQNISVEIFSLCRIPTPAEQEFSTSEHGNSLSLLNWLNEEAQQGFENKANAPFPVGATIVKEKFFWGENGLELAALGILIKHAPGYDSAYGDWEFGYWEAESGMSTGAETQAYCGACHATSTTDFVFLDQSWRSPRPPQ